MLSFTNVTLRRGPRALFEHATFTLYPGWKAGLTGANGTGKSSLFALIRGDLTSDAGEVQLPPGTVIAEVAQETPATDRPAVEYVIDGDRELRTIEAALTEAEQQGDGTAQAELHARLEAVRGYEARARAGRLMHGLGFSSAQEEQPVNAFSGGWRMRLNLAQALMCSSDLLLLDEPTNHLDLDAVFWLENWLRSYPGTLLLISHDREFLDRCVDQILHIENGGVRLYAGNYSDFEAQRSEALAHQQAAHEKQQHEVAEMRRFVDRFRAKATKARQAQSRLKALARMESIAPAHVDSPFHFAFREPRKLPTPLVTLEATSAGYGATPVVAGIRLSLLPGDRIGLLGANGAGKSTLMKLLAGQLPVVDGRRAEAPDLAIGYFAQHQLEQLDGNASPLLHLNRLDPKATEADLRKFLGGFGFRGDAALEPVAPLSGGEKARLVLALIVYQRPNLLLLDEPTNHLDLEMRHALTTALQDYEGAMVVVSHDRHLLRATADQLLVVADGKVIEFDGDLDDYRRWLDDRKRIRPDDAGSDQAGQDPNSAVGRRERRRDEAEKRTRLQPLRREMQKTEKRIEALSLKQNALEEQLADPELYTDSEGKARLTRILREKGQIDQDLAEAEEAWLKAGEAMESAERPA
ncbi:ATP-binding cassette domain-containing protein [Thiohalomonas denitrificans]|uniref:ATP-binding cassette domain-containing protein n=1 Tax=Thiohalomonas denitrificans TaxID=415747 RepID=UPI0026EB67BC|nr:ATP-binding cassette domain-containing protein [Thiohalomonas denitrificans]